MGNILICSQKSNVGKTVLGIKIGTSLSDEGKNVLLMDLSSGKKKMSEYLNVDEEIIYDIKDVLDGTCSLDQALIEIKNNLFLLPYPRLAGKIGDIKIKSFANLINEAKKTYDIIIIDIDKITLSYIDFSLIDHIIIVNNNDFSSVKQLNIDKSIANKYGDHNIITVINNYNKKKAANGTMMKLKDIQKLVELNVDSVIEENPKYSNIDYEFLFSNDENSFNNAVRNIKSKIS